jgi:hypothetical protein
VCLKIIGANHRIRLSENGDVGCYTTLADGLMSVSFMVSFSSRRGSQHLEARINGSGCRGDVYTNHCAKISSPAPSFDVHSLATRQLQSFPRAPVEMQYYLSVLSLLGAVSASTFTTSSRVHLY